VALRLHIFHHVPILDAQGLLHTFLNGICGGSVSDGFQVKLEQALGFTWGARRNSLLTLVGQGESVGESMTRNV